MYVKNLNSILKTFNKTIVDLEKFIDSNLKKTSTKYSKITQMEKDIDLLKTETKQAHDVLNKLKEFIGV